MDDSLNITILEEIGRGENTVVSRAYDRDLVRYVAVKALLPNATEDQKTRFLEQARFLAKLQDGNFANLVNVYSYDSKNAWMIMEYLPGSIEDRLRTGRLEDKVCLSILRQALEALKYLHDLGYIHGSIRPSNILIDEDGHIKLSDFRSPNRDGSIKPPQGSLTKYAAPEVWKGELGSIGPATDFYCLGMTMLDCLYGDSLDSKVGQSEAIGGPELFWGRWHVSPDHSARVEKLIPKSWGVSGQILLEMLQQSPANRPQSASELLKRFSQVDFVPVSIEGLERASELVAPKGPTESSTNSPSNPFAEFAQPSSTGNDISRNAVRAKSQAVGKRGPKASSKGNLRIDLSDTKTFRIVAISVLSIAGIFGLLLQNLMNPSMGLLEVEDAPPDTTIVLRDEDKTEIEVPLKGSNGSVELKAGKYVLVVEAKGFDKEDKKLEITSGESKKYIFDLKPTMAELTFDPFLDGTKVLVDGKVVDAKDGKIAVIPGEHKIEVSVEGCVDQEPLKLTVGPGEKTTQRLNWQVNVLFTLSDNLIGQSVEGIAEVNGEEMRIPLEDEKGPRIVLPVGTHQVRFAAAGFEEKQFPIDVRPGMLSLPIDLKKLEPKELADDESTKRDALQEMEAIMRQVEVFPRDIPNLQVRIGDQLIPVVGGRGEFAQPTDRSVSRLNVSASADGYKPFTGLVDIDRQNGLEEPPTTRISMQLEDSIQARRLWLFARKIIEANRGEMISRDDLRDAINLLSQAIELEPKSSVAYRDRAVAHYFRKELENARKDIQQAIRQDDEDYFALCIGTSIFYESDDLKVARKLIDRAINIYPSRLQGRILRAQVAFKTKDDTTATQDAQFVIENTTVPSQIAFAKNILGRHAAKFGRYEEAIQNFDDARKAFIDEGMDPSSAVLNKLRCLLESYEDIWKKEEISEKDKGKANFLLEQAKKRRTTVGPPWNAKVKNGLNYFAESSSRIWATTKER